MDTGGVLRIRSQKVKQNRTQSPFAARGVDRGTRTHVACKPSRSLLKAKNRQMAPTKVIISLLNLLEDTISTKKKQIIFAGRGCAAEITSTRGEKNVCSKRGVVRFVLVTGGICHEAPSIMGPRGQNAWK